MKTIDFLDGSGHLSLTWDPQDQASVDKARAEFEALRDAGYSFFRTVQEETFSAESGALEVRRVNPEEVAPRLELSEPAVQPAEQLEQIRRGQPRSRNKERVVAARPMRGG